MNNLSNSPMGGLPINTRRQQDSDLIYRWFEDVTGYAKLVLTIEDRRNLSHGKLLKKAVNGKVLNLVQHKKRYYLLSKTDEQSFVASHDPQIAYS